MGWSGSRSISLKEELPDHFPFQPNEDLDFVGTGQPFLGWRLPFGESESACFTIPGDGFIVNQFAIAKP